MSIAELWSRLVRRRFVLVVLLLVMGLGGLAIATVRDNNHRNRELSEFRDLANQFELPEEFVLTSTVEERAGLCNSINITPTCLGTAVDRFYATNRSLAAPCEAVLEAVGRIADIVEISDGCAIDAVARGIRIRAVVWEGDGEYGLIAEPNAPARDYSLSIVLRKQ